MIFDIVFLVILLFGIRQGFREGLLHTLFSAIGYVAGAIGGLYFALQYNHSAWVLLAIAVGAGLGSFLGRLLARALKITIIRGPLAWINAVAGVAFEALVISIVAFFVGTAILWAPWPAGQNVLAESKAYLYLSDHMPDFLSSTFSTITKEFEKKL